MVSYHFFLLSFVFNIRVHTRLFQKRAIKRVYVVCILCGVIITELLVQFEKKDALTSKKDVKREMYVGTIPATKMRL